MTAMPAPPSPSRPVLRPIDPLGPDSDLSLDDLGSRIVGLAGRIAAATGRWLRLVAEFDAREGFARFGLASTARWLSHACGISHRTAVEHVRVARALNTFPALAEGLGSGELSYSHVRAISRLAREGETDLVADLVDLARHASVGQVETMVRGLRTVDDNQRSGAEQPPPEEYLSRSWTSSSQWRCHARLAPEDGAVVDAAIKAVSRAEDVTAPQALVRLAEIALAVLADAGRMPRPLRGEERAAVVIHLDAASVPPEAEEQATPAADEEVAGAEAPDPETEPVDSWAARVESGKAEPELEAEAERQCGPECGRRASPGPALAPPPAAEDRVQVNASDDRSAGSPADRVCRAR